MRSRLPFIALLALLATAPAAQTTYTWNGANPGDWAEASNWSPNGVPGPEDAVVIGSGTATLTANTTVASFELSGSGVLTGDADLTVSSVMTWVSQWPATGIQGSGTVTVAPGAVLQMTGTPPNGRYAMSSGRTLVSQGQAVWAVPAEWSGPGRFVNEGDLELAYDAETPTRFCFSSTTDAVVNAEGGVIRRTGAGELVVYCPFANHGLIEVHTGTLRMRDFNGAGGTDSGEYVLSEGAVLIFDGSRTLTGTASVTGDGIVRTGGNSSSTATINGALDVPVIEITGGVGLILNVDASVDTLRMGGVLTSSRRLGGSGTLTVRHDLTWTQGYFEGSGATLVAEGATLSLDVQTSYSGLRGSRRLINEGAATWTSSGSHHLSNHSDAVFENRGTVTVTAFNNGAFSDFFAGHFVNAEGGVLRRTGAGETRFGSGFDNHGTVEILEGAIELNGFNATGGTDSGTYVLADSTRLELTGGHRTLTETAEVAGTGTVVASGPLTNGGTWRPGVTTGTLTIESDYPAEEGVLEVEIGGAAPGDEYDQLVVTGEATLGGTLRLLLLDDFVPQTGDRFTVLTAGEVTGAFATIEAPEGVEATVETTDTTAVVVIGQVTVANEDPTGKAIPWTFALHAPYPNPTAGSATLTFELPEAASVRLAVYDVLGRAVAVLVDEERAAGRYEVGVDGRGLAVGLYLVRLHAGPLAATQRLTVMR